MYLGERVVASATFIRDSNALLTASALGKTAATLGAKTTMFDDSRSRLAYFPLTIGSAKSDRLYSARSSSLRLHSAFFTNLSLSLARDPSANDSDCVAFFGVTNHKHPAAHGYAESDVSELADRMIRVGARYRHGIAQPENRGK